MITDLLNVCSAIGANRFCSTNILAQYKENQIVCSTTPIWSNYAYSICWSKRKWKQNFSKMAAKLK